MIWRGKIKTGRPPKNTDREILERTRPWERYGVSRASWYRYRVVLGDNPEFGYLDIMRLKKMRKKNRDEAKRIDNELRRANKSY